MDVEEPARFRELLLEYSHSDDLPRRKAIDDAAMHRHSLTPGTPAAAAAGSGAASSGTPGPAEAPGGAASSSFDASTSRVLML